MRVRPLLESLEDRLVLATAPAAVTVNPAVPLSATNFPTIQQGIDAVRATGTVHVAPGVYHETLFIDKPVYLSGDDPATTILQGPGRGIGITVNAGLDLYDFGIRGWGTGLLAGDDTNYLGLNSVRFTSNKLGGTVYALQSLVYEAGDDTEPVFVKPQALALAGNDPIDFHGVQTLVIGGGGQHPLAVFLDDTPHPGLAWINNAGVALPDVSFSLFYHAVTKLTVVLGVNQWAVVQSQAPYTMTNIYGQGHNVFNVAVDEDSYYTDLGFDGAGTSTLRVFPAPGVTGEVAPWPGGGIGEVQVALNGLKWGIGYQNMAQELLA